MRRILLLLVFVIGFLSCQKDDFCLEPTTPNLVIRFYDFIDRTETKAVTDLTVTAEGKDPIFENVSTDSIYIPLDVSANQTIYDLKSGDDTDRLIITYEVEEVFVSRSCGFKAKFNNITITNDDNWIRILDPSEIESIENDNTAHVQIFH